MTNIQSNNIAFCSRFARTEPLRKMFYDLSSGNGSICSKRMLTNAIDSLLNDGKDDIIEISGGRFSERITANINGKEEVSSDLWNDAYYSLGNAVENVIISLAEKRSKKLDFNKILKFEDKIVKTHKKKIINNVSKPKTSLDDIISFATEEKNKASSKIRDVYRQKFDAIAKKIFGEDCYSIPFKDYD